MFSVIKSTSKSSVSGYFQNQHWISLICQQPDFNRGFPHYKQCLQHKVIYMLGDSTVRQLFLHITKHLFLFVNYSLNPNIWQQPKVAYDQADSFSSNITIYHRDHGLPVKGSGPPFTKPFIADTIRYLKVGGNMVYVVFSIGIHFHEIDPSLFLQRLKHIRIAILNHHQKYPDTKFTIKGMDNVGKVNFWNWHLYRYEIILRKYFKNIKNVLFVKFWDLTTVWRLYTDIHPPLYITHQESLLLLSHMCD